VFVAGRIAAILTFLVAFFFTARLPGPLPEFFGQIESFGRRRREVGGVFPDFPQARVCRLFGCGFFQFSRGRVSRPSP